MNNEEPVELVEADLIGTGTRRFCYAYPDKPEFCIKIPRQTKNGQLQQRREIKYYSRLKKRGVPTERVTRFHQVVSTSLGDGYVYDAIRDFDGECSLQLIHYLNNEPERVSEYLAMIKLLESYFFDNEVLFYDLNPYNILCRKSQDDNLEPFVIDGVGDVVAIPVLNYSRYLLKKKIERRWLRFIKQMKKRCDWMTQYSPDYSI